jgi:hypothetical protein
LNNSLLLNIRVKPNQCVDFDHYYLMGDIYNYNNDITSIWFKVKFDKNKYSKDNTNDTLPKSLGYLYYYYHISSLKLENYDKTIDIQLGNDYQNILFELNQFYMYFYSVDEIHTYYDYLDSKKELTDSVTSINSSFNYYAFYESDVLIQLSYNLSPVKSIYFRKYMNFQDVINNLNSIISVISIVFNILSSSYNLFRLKQKITGEVFLLNTSNDDYSILVNKFR